MNNPTPPTTDIARFIPGLCTKGVSSMLLRTEFVVAITLFAVLVPTAISPGSRPLQGCT